MIAFPRRAHYPQQGGELVARLTLAWCVIAIFLSIVWPRYGFLSVGFINATPFTLLAISTWIALPVVMVFNREVGSKIWRSMAQRGLVVSLFLVWLSWRFFSSIVSDNNDESLTYFMRQFVYFIPILLVALLLTSESFGRWWVLDLIIFSTALVMIAGVAEMISGQSVPRLMGLQFAGDAQNLSNIAESNLRFGESNVRLQSVFYHPIVFAQYLSWAAPFLLHATISRRPIWIRVAAGICLILAPFFIFKTDARSGLLAFGGALAAYFALSVVRRTGFISLQFAVAAAGALALLLAGASAGQSTIGGLIQGRNATEASSSRVRSVMIERGLNELKASPIVGFGDGQSPYYAGLRGRNGILTIDSAYLSALLDGGWVGLFLNILAWGGALLAACRAAIRRGAGGLDAAVAASLVAVMMVFAILSIMDNITLILISIAMTVGTNSQAMRAHAPSLQRPSTRNAPIRAHAVTQQPKW